VSEWERARAVYVELLDLARARRWAEVVCDALNRLATVTAQGFFDLERALALLDEARAAAEQSGDAARLAETEWNLAQITFYCWRLERSLAHGRRALGLALDLGQQELEARCRNIVAYNAMMTGAIDEAVEQAGAARALFAALGNRAMEVDCLSIVATLLVHSGAIQEGMAAAREGVAIGRAVENPWGEANCTHALARGLLDAGAWGEALEVAQHGVAAARAAGHPPTLVFNLLALGAVERAHAALDAARAAHAEAQGIAEAMRHPLLIEWSAIEMCADAALAGDWGAAHEHALRALGLRDYGRVYVGMTRWMETEALARAGDAARAAEDLRRAEESQMRFPRVRMLLARGLAVLAAAEGDLSAAAAHLGAAAALAETLGLLYDRWQIDAALAELHAAAGDGAAAERHRARAAETACTLATSITDERLRAGFLAA
jgi:hypothetical protein